MPIKLGNKADGDDFFDRINERNDLWHYLEGNHIMLSGPRRLGKTSLLQRLAEEAVERGLMARLVDVEGIDTPAAFIAELQRAFPDDSVTGHLKAARDETTDWLARLRKLDLKLPGGLSGSVELQVLPDAPWAEAAMKLQQRLTTAPVLILLDEFSVFLEKLLARNPTDAERLLAWLRAWRQQSQVICRFLFSGSINLNMLLERHRLSTRFNDCHDYRLGPFRPQAALHMLAEQCAREGWQPEPAALDYMCNRTGWLSPFYLNLLLATSLEAARDRCEETRAVERRLLISDVDDAYNRLLATRSRFIHWHQRLERELAEPQLGFTLAVLSAVARSETGLTRRQLMNRLQRHEPDPDQRSTRLRQVMLLLEEDGYLDAAGEHIQFLSFLLRDYWRRNHAR